MRFAGNVIWFIFGGAITALFWLLGALIFAVSIVGLPLTRSAIEMAKLSAWPFGREVVHVRELDGRELDLSTAATGTIGFIFNILWAITFGLWLCLSYVALGILWCFTLIGIPFGLQAFKLAGISLWPVGRRVVTKELAQLARETAAEEKFAGYRSKGRKERADLVEREPLLTIAPAARPRLDPEPGRLAGTAPFNSGQPARRACRHSCNQIEVGSSRWWVRPATKKSWRGLSVSRSPMKVINWSWCPYSLRMTIRTMQTRCGWTIGAIPSGTCPGRLLDNIARCWAHEPAP